MIRIKLIEPDWFCRKYCDVSGKCHATGECIRETLKSVRAATKPKSKLKLSASARLTKSRQERGIHLKQHTKIRLRAYLIEAHGPWCCWCGGYMVEGDRTIEHHFAVNEGKPSSKHLLRLAHTRCNQ